MASSCCSGITGELKENSKFKCQRCAYQQTQSKGIVHRGVKITPFQKQPPHSRQNFQVTKVLNPSLI